MAKLKLNKKNVNGVYGNKYNFFENILLKLKRKKKITKNERIYYHRLKRDTASIYMSEIPDKNINDIRLSVMYHNNCLEKALGNKKFFKSNSKLYDMALSYAIKHENKPLYSIKSKDGSFRI